MKITKIFALIFFAAAQIFAQESSEDSFNDIDFVQFGSSRKKTEYVIGENSQSVTAKRRIVGRRKRICFCESRSGRLIWRKRQSTDSNELL